MKARSKQRGFSIIEILVVVAITAIVTALTIPWFGGIQRQNQVNTISRKIVSLFNQARITASSGRVWADAGNPAILYRTNRAIVQFTGTSPTRRMELFIADPDDNRASIEVIDLQALFPDNRVQIETPGTDFEVSFWADGSSTAATFTVSDETIGLKRQVQVSGVGLLKVF